MNGRRGDNADRYETVQSFGNSISAFGTTTKSNFRNDPTPSVPQPVEIFAPVQMIGVEKGEMSNAEEAEERRGIRISSFFFSPPRYSASEFTRRGGR